MDALAVHRSGTKRAMSQNILGNARVGGRKVFEVETEKSEVLTELRPISEGDAAVRNTTPATSWRTGKDPTPPSPVARNASVGRRGLCARVVGWVSFTSGSKTYGRDELGRRRFSTISRRQRGCYKAEYRHERIMTGLNAPTVTLQSLFLLQPDPQRAASAALICNAKIRE